MVEATVHRARPVLLTALAAMLAFVPLTLDTFWGPLAFVLIGGVGVGTVLTLLFVPALYMVFFRKRPGKNPDGITMDGVTSSTRDAVTLTTTPKAKRMVFFNHRMFPMKKTIALALTLLFSPLASASQSFGPAFDFTKSGSVTVAQVLAKPAGFLQQPFTVQGKIDAVCQKKGCWMQFATAADQPTFRLKVKDSDMVFPVSAKGKNAYAHGSLKAKPMTLEQTKT